MHREAIDVREAALRLKCAQVTVRRLIARRELPAHRIGPRLIRIWADDLDKIGAPIGGAA